MSTSYLFQNELFSYKKLLLRYLNFTTRKIELLNLAEKSMDKSKYIVLEWFENYTYIAAQRRNY